MSATSTMTAVVPQRRVMSLQAGTTPVRASSLRHEARFGQYVLGQTLGEGEFGKVKLGWPIQRSGSKTDAQVAIKLIRRESVGTSRSRMNKIEREIRVLRRVRHPNIVKCYEVIETEKHIGIILEYASGGELFDYILAHRYLKDPVACKLFAQLISAVHYLHTHGIVHRDLKLENLLLDRNKDLIITDFGFANTFDVEHSSDDAHVMKRKELTSNGQILGDLMQTSCGSPCYAAPELVVSDGFYCGRKVDVWSCGVILYAMLSGYLPFDDDPSNPEGDNISQLYKYIIESPLTFPEYVSPLARDLLRRVLVPDPRKRVALKDVVAHEWIKPHSQILLGSKAGNMTFKSQSSDFSHDAAHAQDMVRSSSERTAAHARYALPVTNHLVATGFTRNSTMGPPSVSAKRHTLQIEYETPRKSSNRTKQYPEQQKPQDDSSKDSDVDCLSIAAAPTMARSASHSGVNTSSPNVENVHHNRSSDRYQAHSSAQDVDRRLQFNRPVVQAMSIESRDIDVRSDFVDERTASHYAHVCASSADMWSTGRVRASKTASPRSTKQNASGEIYSANSTAPSQKTIEAQRTLDKPPRATTEHVKGSKHRRNASSISGLLGKFWPTASSSDSRTIKQIHGDSGRTMVPIAETDNNSTALHHVVTNRPVQKDVEAAMSATILKPPVVLGKPTALASAYAGSNSNLVMTRSAGEAHQSEMHKSVISVKDGGHARASSSAAKRVMDFFTGRRKDRL